MHSMRLTMRIAVIAVMFGAATAHAQQGSSATNVAASATSPMDAKSVRAANRQLSKSVRRVLAKVKGLDSTNIVVVAKSGAVTLNGSVPEAGQDEVAVNASRNVSGVTEVTNKLSIKAVGQ